MADDEARAIPEVLEITVSGSGRILLNGQEVSLDELAPALQQARVDGAAVQFSSESSGDAAPPEADVIMRLISANRLRIAFSSQMEQGSAFGGGISHQNPGRETPEAGQRGSKVIELPGPEHFFAKVRRQASSSRGVWIVRPDRTEYVVAAPPPGAISAEKVAAVGAVIPSEQARNIAVIAPGGTLGRNPNKTLSPVDLGREIPFFGLLIGLAYTGHAVWLFEAAPSTMPAGCEDADVLIVDSDAIPNLPSGWMEDAGGIMRNANVLIYDRSRQKMGATRTAGEVPGRIEFPNG